MMGEKRYAVENLNGQGDHVGTLQEIMQFMIDSSYSFDDENVRFYELGKPMKIALLEDK